MRMQVKLEIGHKAACRHEPTPEGFTHDWTVFVRGAEGKDISHFVEKVIFHLHESFPKPKRAIKEPPYKLDESGYGSFELKIEVCFKTKDEPRRVHFTYDLFLPLSGLPPVTSVRTEALTFTHPTEDFMKKLVKGGGVPISAVNGVSNGLSNGHPPPAPREETKEPPQQKSASITEGEKAKKVKVPKSTSKPPTVVGMKRSSPTHEQTSVDGSAKKKKKSSEGTNLSKLKHLQNDSATPASQPLTTEVKDLKVKFKPIPPKETVEKKKEHVSVDGHHKTKTSHSSKVKEGKAHTELSEGKKPDTGEHKVKVKKKEKGEKEEKKKSSEKKEKSKSVKKIKKDKKAIEKVTIRRSSGDSWASAGSASGLMSNVVAKNKALGKLLSEMSDDEDDMDLPTPFKHEPSPVLTKITQKENSVSKSNNVTSLKSKESTGLADHENMTLPQVEHNSSAHSGHSNESTELMKASSTAENGLKDEPVNENKVSKEELYDLYEEITNCQDSDFLQKVVDVIETTGLYTVAEKTFEFDLCCLEKTTLQQLQKCLGIR